MVLTPQGVFTIGVEEEYQIVDPQSHATSPTSLKILPYAEQKLGEIAQLEILQTQLEISTPICNTLQEVRQQLEYLRCTVNQAAQTQGKKIIAAAIHPFSTWKEQPLTPYERYESLERDYQQLAREQIICGCHIHVGIADRELGLQTMNRMRPWLAPLIALTASSPFWNGFDTGYDSYRIETWSRWPTSGAPPHFQTLEEYRQVTQNIVKISGTMEDPTKIYWDMRLSERYQTIEVRVSDVCPTVDEAVMLAGLVQALVRTCSEQARKQIPFIPVPQEHLRFAHWRAARFGLNERLVHVQKQDLVPAGELIDEMLQMLRPALNIDDDQNNVEALVRKVLSQGNSATRQRRVYDETGSLEAVVDLLLEEALQVSQHSNTI